LKIKKQALKNGFNFKETVAASFRYFNFIIEAFNKAAVFSLFKVVGNIGRSVSAEMRQI